MESNNVSRRRGSKSSGSEEFQWWTGPLINGMDRVPIH